MPITNEDFRDTANKLQEDLAKQIGGEVLGVSMFFLIKNKEGKNQWAVISNYNKEVTTANLFYLHQSVAKHIAEDFSDV